MTSNIKSKVSKAMDSDLHHPRHDKTNQTSKVPRSVASVESAPGSLDYNVGVREGEVLEVDGVLGKQLVNVPAMHEDHNSRGWAHRHQ